MKKRILFVDDEPQILEGLRHRLHRQRKKWEMEFVHGGHEALERLSNEPFDVIVTDMRMPRMDGAELLRRVHENHPGIVRIVLSGHAEMEIAFKAVPVAHQFLNKPCDAGLLESVVDRACGLHALINDETVRNTMGKIKTLPTMPVVYNRLMAALARDDTSPRVVAKILEQDLALCAKLLQIVNSAFFRLPRTIAKIEEAVSYLGFNTIKQVVLAVEVFGANGDDPVIAGLSVRELQQHSMLVASIASLLLDDRQGKEDAYVAALLHDIGKLLLAMELPEHFGMVLAAMGEQQGPMYLHEERLSAVTHAEIGAYLLGLWGLPYPIIEAVANHHHPSRVEEQEFGVLGAVHVADFLVNELHESRGDGSVADGAGADREYLEGLGVWEKMDSWRELAQEKVDSLNS